MAYALYGLKELSKEINKYELTYKVNGVVKSGNTPSSLLLIPVE